MAIKKNSNFSAPIPGQSLTIEPRSRPWQNPPQYSTVDEVVALYMPMLGSEEFQILLLEQLENEIPITAITNILVTASVMEGKHSIDVGVLVAPVLIEAMITIAEKYDTSYVIGTEKERYEEDGDDSLELIRRAIEKKRETRGEEKDEQPSEMPSEQQQQQQVDEEMTSEEGPMAMQQDAPMPTPPPAQQQQAGLMSPRGAQ